jgi:hypothetical protein
LSYLMNCRVLRKRLILAAALKALATSGLDFFVLAPLVSFKCQYVKNAMLLT